VIREFDAGLFARGIILRTRNQTFYVRAKVTKKYFEKHLEACAADIYYALSQEIERLNKERIEIGEKPFRRPNYSSFSRYFWWFILRDNLSVIF